MYDFDGDIGTDYHYYMDNSSNQIPLICLESDVDFEADKNYEKTSNYDYVSDNAGLL